MPSAACRAFRPRWTRYQYLVNGLLVYRGRGGGAGAGRRGGRSHPQGRAALPEPVPSRLRTDGRRDLRWGTGNEPAAVNL